MESDSNPPSSPSPLSFSNALFADNLPFDLMMSSSPLISTPSLSCSFSSVASTSVPSVPSSIPLHSSATPLSQTTLPPHITISQVDNTLLPSVPPHTILSPSLTPSTSPHTHSPSNSPDQIYSPANLSPSSSRLSPLPPDASSGSKRKYATKDSFEEELQGFVWSDHKPPSPFFPVFDCNIQPIPQMELQISKYATKAHYSPSDDVWICYRQNQFKICCYLNSPLSQPFYIFDTTAISILGFYAKVYVISNSSSGDEVQVGLVHVGRKRVKKAKTEVVPVLFEAGKVEFSNLQFERSNIGRISEYFHIVVSVYAKAANNSFYLVLSKISPKIMVRSQHPGYYTQPQPLGITEELGHSNNSNSNSPSASPPRTYEFVEETLLAPTPEHIGGWQQAGDTMFLMGKVGINTSQPIEALTVNGNALITGQVYKPSDRRLKSDITRISPQQQLHNIRSLRIYNYQINNAYECGVLAQELAAVLPSAVKDMGTLTIGANTLPNFLVVDERVLLYENIGATQQLDEEIDSAKETIVNIDSDLHKLADETQNNTADLRNKINSVMAVLFAEESSALNEDALVGLKEKQISLGINVFRMGPARSLLILSFFCPWLWFVVALYIFSTIPSRRTIGKSAIFKLLMFCGLYYGLRGHVNHWFIRLVYALVGTILLYVNYKRNLRRIKWEESKEKKKESEEKLKSNQIYEHLIRRGLF